MNVVGALVTVLVIGWAAAHPGAPPQQPAAPDPAGCTITQRADGPVDPAIVAEQRKLAEQLCSDFGAQTIR